MWRGSNCTPEVMYDDFKIHYEQMRRLLEVVCYRLDMIYFGLELAPGGGKKLLRQELGLERLADVGQRIKNLSDELSYQPSKGLRALLGIERCDFYRAQRMRSVTKIFLELSAIEREGRRLSVDERKKFSDRMKTWRAAYREAIQNHFERLLSAGSDEHD